MYEVTLIFFILIIQEIAQHSVITVTSLLVNLVTGHCVTPLSAYKLGHSNAFSLQLTWGKLALLATFLAGLLHTLQL